MQFPIFIGLRRSRFFFCLLVVLHGVAAASLLALPWPPSLRYGLLVLVGLALGYALRPPRIVGLRFAAPDRLDCLLANGQHVVAKALPDSTVFSRLIVLRLRIGAEKRVTGLVVLPDQTSLEQFRLLRLCLRWQVTPKDDGGAVS